MKRNLSPIEWMELQAEKLPAYLLLPEATVRRTVDEWIKHTATLSIEMCDEILRSKKLPTLFQGAA